MKFVRKRNQEYYSAYKKNLELTKPSDFCKLCCYFCKQVGRFLQNSCLISAKVGKFHTTHCSPSFRPFSSPRTDPLMNKLSDSHKTLMRCFGSLLMRGDDQKAKPRFSLCFRPLQPLNHRSTIAQQPFNVSFSSVRPGLPQSVPLPQIPHCIRRFPTVSVCLLRIGLSNLRLNSLSCPCRINRCLL